MNPLNRSMEVIRNEGLRNYPRAIKRYFLWHPIGDEIWYLLNRYLTPSHQVIKQVQGSKMILNLRDKGIHKDLWLHGCREPECTRILKEELSSGMKVIDIGANIGYYALIEASIVGDTGKVYAFEPELKNFTLLRKNVELNHFSKRIELYNLAVGDKSGETFLELSDHSNLHRIAKSESTSNSNKVKITSTTLDDFLEGKYADFIRMDVEGFKCKIIEGMKKILDREDPLKLFIEVHPTLIKDYEGDAEVLLRNLSDANFNVNYLIKKGSMPSASIRYCIKGKSVPPEKCINLNSTTLKSLLNNRKELFAKDTVYSLFMERNLK